MKTELIAAILLCALLALCRCAPADQKDSPREVQSALVPAFDEIVVESSLTVRRKNDAGRQGRAQAPPSSPAAKTRRRRRSARIASTTSLGRSTPSFGAAISDAHAHSANIHGPLGSFDSSATHTQSQAIALDARGGLTTSASLAATQHYHFPNGMRIDVNVSGGAVAVNGRRVSGADQSNAATSFATITQPSRTRKFIHH